MVCWPSARVVVEYDAWPVLSSASTMAGPPSTLKPTVPVGIPPVAVVTAAVNVKFAPGAAGFSLDVSAVVVGMLITYEALATGEFVYPLAVANAWIVSVLLTMMAPEYCIEEVEGAVPSVV